MLVLTGKRKSKTPHSEHNEDGHGTVVEVSELSQRILVNMEFVTSRYFVVIYERRTAWGITNKEYQKVINTIEEAKQWVLNTVGGTWNFKQL